MTFFKAVKLFIIDRSKWLQFLLNIIIMLLNATKNNWLDDKTRKENYLKIIFLFNDFPSKNLKFITYKPEFSPFRENLMVLPKF